MRLRRQFFIPIHLARFLRSSKLKLINDILAYSRSWNFLLSPNSYHSWCRCMLTPGCHKLIYGNWPWSVQICTWEFIAEHGCELVKVIDFSTAAHLRLSFYVILLSVDQSSDSTVKCHGRKLTASVCWPHMYTNHPFFSHPHLCWPITYMCL